ncbi:Ragulator complex protein LAMTOR1 [Myotis davidii]|uniref:Ragulator complex protein LAMTOR1 n=1 Tax=Myotis davidii TaxID=225400 RepID=L5LTJ0_MYODS|nr:Ragulator complex protein LAMTOR1 [Myotis davidii]
MGCCYRTRTRTERSGSCCWTLLAPLAPTKALHGAEPTAQPSARTDAQVLLSTLARTASNIAAPTADSQGVEQRECLAGSADGTRTAPGRHPRACAEQQPGPLEEAAAAATSPSQPPRRCQQAHPVSHLQPPGGLLRPAVLFLRPAWAQERRCLYHLGPMKTERLDSSSPAFTLPPLAPASRSPYRTPPATIMERSVEEEESGLVA